MNSDKVTNINHNAGGMKKVGAPKEKFAGGRLFMGGGKKRLDCEG